MMVFHLSHGAAYNIQTKPDGVPRVRWARTIIVLQRMMQAALKERRWTCYRLLQHGAGCLLRTSLNKCVDVSTEKWGQWSGILLVCSVLFDVMLVGLLQTCSRMRWCWDRGVLGVGKWCLKSNVKSNGRLRHVRRGLMRTNTSITWWGLTNHATSSMKSWRSMWATCAWFQ